MNKIFIEHAPQYISVVISSPNTRSVNIKKILKSVQHAIYFGIDHLSSVRNYAALCSKGEIFFCCTRFYHKMQSVLCILSP